MLSTMLVNCLISECQSQSTHIFEIFNAIHLSFGSYYNMFNHIDISVFKYV